MKTSKSLLWIFVLIVLSSFGYATLTDNNTFYYSFDNTNLSGTDVYDLSSTLTRDGTLTGGASPNQTGKVGQAIYCDGLNDYIKTGYEYAPQQGTWSVWINSNHTATGDYLMGHRSDVTGQNVREILYFQGVYFENSQQPFFSDPADNVVQFQYNISLNDSVWHHIVITYDKGARNYRYWLDGVKLPLTNAVKNETVNHNIATEDFILCGNNDRGTYEDFVRTIIDEFGHWERVLNDTEIGQLYNGGAGYNPYAGGAPPSGESNFTIFAKNNKTGVAINSFNATVNGTNYGTATGTITTNIPNNSSALVNITVYIQGNSDYQNVTETNYNVSTNYTAQLKPFWKIRANNTWTNTTINSFNATVDGTDYSTTAGVITTNVTFDASNVNVALNATNYITRTFTNQSPYNDTTYYLYQTIVNITAIDSISLASISEFNVTINGQNFSTNVSLITIYPDASIYNITVTSIGYDNLTEQHTLVAQTTYNLQFNMTPQVYFNLLKESDSNPLNISATSSTTLYVYCPTRTIEHEFTTNTEYVSIDCFWDFLMIIVDVNGSSYFRTLIGDNTVRNFTWYLIDINTETAYENVFVLNDLTGDYSEDEDTLLIIRKYIDNATRDLIEQRFDLEYKATVFLLRNTLYTLAIRNSAGDEQNLGYFIATGSGEKTITTSNIPFVPTTTFGDTLNWAWTLNATLIRLHYNDSSTHKTGAVNFTIYNGTNTAQILYTTTSTDVGSVIFNYVATDNSSYKACFVATDTEEGTVTECRTLWNTGEMGEWDGWTLEGKEKFQSWSAAIIILLTLLSVTGFYRGSAGIGLAMVWYWIFLHWGWFTLGSTFTDVSIGAFGGVLAVFMFFVEGKKK